MTIEDLQQLCKTFPGMTEDIKWDNHLCFNVGGKMFMVTSPDSVPQTVSFKATDEDFDALTQRDGFIPAPYMARYKWVFADNINRLDKNEWKTYARRSYDLVFEKLPAKLRKEIQK